MGGISSGRYDRARRFTTEEVAYLDARQIFRSPLVPHQWRPCPISNNKHRLSLYYQVTHGQIILGTNRGNGIREISRIPLKHSSRNFGGHQSYFVCPESHCRKRVAMLYLTNKVACRTCSNLAYESQHENASFRQLRRARKLRRKIGAQPLLLAPLPDKPKRMQHQTYDQIVFMIYALELQAAKAIHAGLTESFNKKLDLIDELFSSY